MAKKTEQPKAPSATTVILVRHGQTTTTGSILPGRAPGLHLAETGRDQADRAAQRLAGLTGVTALYTSPLERTRETSAPIGKALGLRPKVNRGLLECDFGEWTGRKLSDLMKLPEWRTVQNTPSRFRFPGGESFVEMQARIVGAIDTLVRDHPGETIVLVSHADPIKAAVAHASGSHLDVFQRIVISPCSLTPILMGTGAPVVLSVNSTGDDLSALKPS